MEEEGGKAGTVGYLMVVKVAAATEVVDSGVAARADWAGADWAGADWAGPRKGKTSED